MADSGDGTKTPEERADLDARDLRLKRGLIAGDRVLTAEAFEIIRAYLGKVARRRARWLLRADRWTDACQEVFATIARWQKEGGEKLNETESLWYFTIRVLKQVAQPFKTDKNWAALAFSLEDQSVPKDQLKLEGEAEGSIYAPQRFAPPERQVAALETWTWISLSTERLSEDDQRVLQAIGDVENGQAETLGAALGIKDGAARVRKHRWLERLTSAAITEGNREMARRCGGKKYAEALELLHVEQPGAAHRIEELRLLRDGELETATKIELEKHLETCAGCKRTLRTIEPTEPEEPTLAFLPLVAPDFDFSRFLPRAGGGRGRMGKALGVGAAVLATIAALAWWFAQPKIEPPPPLQQFPSTPQKAVPVPKRTRPRLMSAPAAEPVDAGLDAGR